MTTIAFHYKSKQIAVDSRMSSGDIILSDNVDKSFCTEGCMFFLCGDSSEIMEFSGCYPEFKRYYDCYGLILDKGSVYNIGFEGKKLKKVLIDFDIACGSGEEFALAAMDFGKSAEEAVEYAMTRDSATGGKVHVFDIEKNEFI